MQSIDEDGLAIRAAWLHYAGGLTQAEVAKRLRIPSVKAHRLISRANQAGAVKVTIDGEIAECVALESQLTELYDLSYCEVVPDLLEEGLPLRALGTAGAGYLRRELERGQSDLVGFGHGRTLAAVVGQLPRMSAGDTKFVSLLGGLNRNYAANPHDVMHRLADKTGAEAYFMPVPFFANSQGDREVLLAQRGVRDVLEMAASSSVKLVGIGTVEPDAYLVSSGMIELAEIEDIKAKGGVGELLGHFFDDTGAIIETPLTDRTMSVGLAGLKDTQLVAVAGGEEKTRAIRSALMSKFLSGIITDERTAIALINQN
ncbi:Erythritol transcriptional regulator EryD [Candidatus Rhodobacter oscarellae]|uniref:Erythritol transcriptional regulator EryD n=1 Tax=Candidatus Rhodobacter oscarellae TaxID=1675527 RepID=A0A0J9E0A4_9RHOB|nr:sugar-binding transcriptional regulator [Candidatus Rhodobacter lobularis]KMW56150.1 Erythritol transcriptional regulator EryD [Candidatus Rhodobacter lobularis]